ncbi:hypothetical protein [Methylibium petroleiphilum]
MKEPITLAAAAVAGGASASLGVVMGIPFEALIAGLFGGMVGLFLLPATGKRPQRGPRFYAWLGGSVASSVTVAGFLGPYSAALFNAPTVPDHLEILGFSFLWGAGAQVLLAAAIAGLQRRIDQLGGNGP